MRLLTTEEVCAELGIGDDTLREMRKAGEIPYINIGRGKKRETPRYDPEDVAAWKAKRKKIACPSIEGTIPRTVRTPTTSRFEVIDFQARRNARRSEKQDK